MLLCLKGIRIPSCRLFLERQCLPPPQFFHSSPLRMRKKKLWDPPRPPLLYEETTTRSNLLSFDHDVILYKLIKKNLTQMKVAQMTEIQSKMFDPVDKGHDVTAVSPAGSGKTLSFLIPWVNRRLLDYKQIKKGIHMVILTPTSLHARMLYNEVDAFLAMMGPNITMQAVYDSYSFPRQVQRLSKKIPRILVATPSCLRKHLEDSVLSKVKNRKKPNKKKRTVFSSWFNDLTATLVLDEADHLMHVHREDVDFILPYMARERQTIVVSSNELVWEDHLLKPDAVRIDCRLQSGFVPKVPPPGRKKNNNAVASPEGVRLYARQQEQQTPPTLKFSANDEDSSSDSSSDFDSDGSSDFGSNSSEDETSDSDSESSNSDSNNDENKIQEQKPVRDFHTKLN